MAKETVNISLQVKDNTKLEHCFEMNKDVQYSVLGFKKELTSDYKKKIFIGLVHYFLTEIITSEEVDRLLEGTKWKRNTNNDDGIYDATSKRICNFIGVVSKEFEITKQEIIEASGNGYDSEIYGQNKKNKCKIYLSLQIISRFDKVGKPYFLQTLLLKGQNLGFSNQNVYASDDGYYDFLLMALFKNYFIEASNKGYYKTYHTFYKNDNKLKGIIDFPRHIRENIGKNNGNIAYSYRENSIINYMNMLIITAFECLQDKYPDLTRNFVESDVEVMTRLDFIKFSIIDHMQGMQTIISKNLTPINHPYYHDYESLRNICLKILRNEGMAFENDEKEVQGILYYIPDLWEEFLLEKISGAEYDLQYQYDKTKIFDYNNDEDFKTKIKPDYLFFDKSNEPKPFIVLDAKFKKEWWIRLKRKTTLGKIDDTSMMPDYDECIRYLNAFAVDTTGVIFPAEEKDINNIEEYLDNYIVNTKHNISKYNTKDHFFTFPIFVPSIEKTNNYESWLKQFEEHNEKVYEGIQGVIMDEFKKRVKNVDGGVS